MNLKFSMFNLVDEVEPGVYSFYNAKNGRHAMLRLEESYKDIVLSGDNEKINLLQEDVRKQLIEFGFIVECDHDELEELRQLSIADQKNKYSGLCLTVLPTLKCNFCCPYCFEDERAISSDCFMSKETQDNVVKFTEEKFAAGVRGDMHVKWFGGEPLLAEDIIFNLSARLKKVAESYDSNYRAIMMTNGYHLDKLTEKHIKDLSLYAIQITLDGPEHIHNKRRVARNGDNTFKRIITNIERMVKFFDGIVIRINADRTNAPYIPELFEYLYERGISEVCKRIYLGYVDTEVGRYSVESQCASLLNKEDIEYIYSIVSAGLVQKNIAHVEFLSHPRFLSVACDAQIKNYYVIDPEGFVFKCGSDATIRERSLFNINTRTEINPEREKLFLDFSARSDDRCKNCAQLPVCNGGCVAKYLDINTQDIQHCWPFCHVMRPNLLKIARRNIK